MTAPAGPETRGDGELVRAVLAGDRAAYRHLVERHEDVLYRRAVALLRDRDLAADMVQQTFIRGYERLADCAEPDRFGGWVYRALRNRCYDDLRSARRRGEPLPPAATLPGEDDPDADLERSELRRVVAEALHALSPLLREAFVLKHVDGLSYEEMQQAADASMSALKMRVKRAREELAQRLTPYVDPDADVTHRPSGSSHEYTGQPPVEREQAS